MAWQTPDPAFLEFETIISDELKKPGIQLDTEWVNKPAYFIPSFAGYYHDKGMYEDEWKVLRVMRDFLGTQSPEWWLKAVENRLLSGKLSEAREQWNSTPSSLRETAPLLLAEGLLLRAEGNVVGAVNSFEKAAVLDGRAFRPHMELALSHRLSGDAGKADAEWMLAQRNVRSLLDFKILLSLQGK